MTTSEPPRRPARRSFGRGRIATTKTVRSEVGETLRDARENRGVDLHRVERDTKIRLKFLAALEDGEFTELPGRGLCGAADKTCLLRPQTPHLEPASRLPAKPHRHRHGCGHRPAGRLL